MLKHFIFFVIISFLSFELAIASKLSEKRQKILAVVNEELKESLRLSRQFKDKNPDVLLRVAELNLEKARLWREHENEIYLALSVEQRRSRRKEDYFKESSRYFIEANKYGLNIVNNFKKYKGIGEVYYILAYNFKELGDYKKSQQFFALSAKQSPSGSVVNERSKLALADSYFNEKKFKEAIPLYESSLKGTTESWWTKDSFNLAWCYYRVKQYNNAISKMKEIYEKSKTGKFIDMRPYVERDIGIFYVDSNQLEEGVKYYKGIGINFSQHLTVIAESLIPQGKFTQAETLLKEALKIEKDETQLAKIYLIQLDLYDKYNKIAPHLSISKKLVQYHATKKLSNEALKKLTFHVSKKAAELQKVVAGDLYRNVPKTRQLKAKQAVNYFELQDLVQNKKTSESNFYQAETWFAVGQAEQATKSYLLAYDLSFEEKQTKWVMPALEGMLASLALPGLSQSTAEKYYEDVYTRYLKTDKKSNRAQSIYKKLFKYYLDKNDLEKSEKVLAEFSQQHPDDFKTQEAMLSQIMENYRKNKNNQKLRSFIADIDNGKYKISKSYATKLRQLLTSIQMGEVEQAMSKGEKNTALNGYIKIYNDPDSTTTAKTNAAYNIGVLYYEGRQLTDAHKWALLALSRMSPKEAMPFLETFMTISSALFMQQNFELSNDLTLATFDKICNENTNTKNIALKNLVYIYLADAKVDAAVSVLQKSIPCGVTPRLIDELRVEIGKELILSKSFTRADEILSPIVSSPQAYLALEPLTELKNAYKSVGDENKASDYETKINQIFNQALAQKKEIPVSVLRSKSIVALNRIKAKSREIFALNLTFPEEVFNNLVKRKLAILETMEKDIQEINNLGAGDSIVEANHYKIISFEHFSLELKNFIPEGKNEEYTQSFRKAMSSIYEPLAQNALKMRAEIKDLIYKNKILTSSNHDVLKMGNQASFYQYSKPYVIMDRGGKR